MLVVVSYNLSSLPDLRQKQVYERRVSCLIFHAVNKPRFGSHASCSVLCLNRLLVLFGRGDWYIQLSANLIHCNLFNAMRVRSAFGAARISSKVPRACE